MINVKCAVPENILYCTSKSEKAKVYRDVITQQKPLGVSGLHMRFEAPSPVYLESTTRGNADG
jgi:hypothetical protein